LKDQMACTMDEKLSSKFEKAMELDEKLEPRWKGERRWVAGITLTDSDLDELMANSLAILGSGPTGIKFSAAEIVSILKAAPYNSQRKDSESRWTELAQRAIKDACAPPRITTEDEAAASGYPAEWRPRSLKEIANRAWETPHSIPWVIKDILAAQSALLCSGQPHATKSIDWLAACIEAAVKHTVWGKFDASAVKRTLFIETEDPEWLVENRVVSLMKGLGLKQTDDLEKYGFFFSATGPFDLVKTEKQLRALIDSVKPDFTVLSTLQGLVPGRSLSEQKDMSEPNAMVVNLAKLTPMIVITHSPRDSSVRRSYGAITQDANYLTLMHFEKDVKGDETTIHVTGDSKLGTELDFKIRMTCPPSLVQG
jgi:hypothetical protein